MMKNLNKIVKESRSRREVLEKLGYKNFNGRDYTKLNKELKKQKIEINHFSSNGSYKTIKYKIIDKICPVCNVSFKTKEGSSREKTVCSLSCSNTYFRTGIDRANASTNYRTICWKHHTKKCIICGEEKIVAVHHFDGNHKNNKVKNLIPLCPTHHVYMHSSYKNEILSKVLSYIKDF